MLNEATSEYMIQQGIKNQRIIVGQDLSGFTKQWFQKDPSDLDIATTALQSN